ncbi:MAG TPA: peptide chain release factor 2, partial [Microbacteriaceae bacterium]|nr:peptide chain release factor 2 [Microbacteriaceae bacterium]
MELDLSADIAALRATFTDIAAVIDVERLQGDIDALSAQAGVPDLWDDPKQAQQVTSRLSHAQSQLARVTGVAQRLDDIEVLIELAV